MATNDITQARRFKEKKFKRIGLTGDWLAKYGDIEEGKTLFIWGESGGGKSTEAIKLFDFLTRNYGKGLYIAGEEGLGGTLQKRIDENMTEFNNNYSVCSQKTPYKTLIEMEKAKKNSRARFKVIVIDSYQLYDMNYRQYKELRDALPWALIIGINQMKPDYEPYGGNQIKHDADVKVRIVGGKAHIISRFLPEQQVITLFQKQQKQPTQTALFQ